MSHHQRPVRRPAHRDGSDDEGSALILALVLILIASFMVLPVMNYTMGVMRTNHVLTDKATRVEAVKGGLRAALYDPAKLYAACLNSGRTTAVQLAVPPGLGISSQCTTTKDALQDVPSDLRFALATTQVGSNALVPPPYVAPPERPDLDGTVSATWCTSLNAADPNARTPCGRPYPLSGDLDPMRWLADTSTTTAGSKVFLPYLPPVPNSLAYASGYAMPVGDDGPCRVFFPGRYTDDVVITGATPVYFVSGIYYFEKTVRISGDARVVVGAGATPGCVESDAVAVADAIDAPFDAYSSGVGGTFVFGANGRLIVDTATPSGSAGIKLTFNRRLVSRDDPLAVLNDISIMSVTGVWTGTDTVALDIPAQLHVPETLVYGATPTDAWVQRYKASTLVSTVTPPVGCAPPPAAVTPDCPIIELNFTSGANVQVKIPGYVSVPQGSVLVNVAAGANVGKTISFGGGVLAAQISVPGTVPDSFQLGLVNPVVQKTFRITTTTTSGSPTVTATALVQVNATGGYAVNSWVVQTD